MITPVKIELNRDPEVFEIDLDCLSIIILNIAEIMRVRVTFAGKQSIVILNCGPFGPVFEACGPFGPVSEYNMAFGSNIWPLLQFCLIFCCSCLFFDEGTIAILDKIK